MQTGQQNVAATIEWAQANLLSESSSSDPSASASPLSSLVVMGYSAGSLGAQAWAGALTAALPAARQAVVFDSYVGAFPAGVQGTVLRDDWPTCDGGPLATQLESLGLLGACANGTLSMEAWTRATIAAAPAVPFGHIQSKTDETQQWFYAAIAATFFKYPLDPGGPAFYNQTNAILLGYDGLPNAVRLL